MEHSMDMNYIERLLKYGYILTEAAGGKPDKTTDKDRYFRLIEDELKDYFKFPGFALDDSMRMGKDVILGHGALSDIARQQQEARLNSLAAEGADADEELVVDDEGGYRLGEFLRVFITGLFIHPSDVGGWGIGNSQTARGILESIAEDPEERGRGGSDGTLRPDMLGSPDTYPEGLKNYIALLSKKFIRGIIRIGFEECGLLSYLVYNSRDIMGAVAAAAGVSPDGEEIKDVVSPKWDFNKLFHLAHEIVPRFVLKTLVAPAVPTPNCDKALIEQNAAYLGESDLQIIQSFVTPIDTGFDTDLRPAGEGRPADYSDLARYAAAWNFSMQDIKDRASHDASGNTNTYTPPEDSELPATMSADDTGLLPRYTTRPNKDGTYQYKDTEYNCIRREYPSQKFGHWTVVDVDNDQAHFKDNESILGKGYTVMEGPDGKAKVFWFRGGDQKDGDYDFGVGDWCWTGSLYGNYRRASEGDRGYMLIHDRVTDPEILKYRNGGNGTPYDSSAFGVVVAGSDKSGIPGLMKATCFQGRVDTTDSSNRPGASKAVQYDTSIVPYGGNIPGLIKYGRWSNAYSEKKSIASAINNSIFCLALIGKWDNSIRVTNGEKDPERIEFYTDELVRLMQKWFPVNIESRKTDPESKKRTIRLYKLGDISTLGRILSDAGDDNLMTKDILLSIYQTPSGDRWHLFRQEKTDDGVTGCIFVPADDEFRLMSRLSKGSISQEQYDEEIAGLPALMFTMEDDRFIPFLSRKITAGDASRMLGMWTQNRVRPLRERVGAGETTSTEESGNPGSEIHWAQTMKSSGKLRNVGHSDDGTVWIRGPETEGKPLALLKSKDLAGILQTSALRGTYIVTESGEYNIWITAEGNGSTELYVGYVRNSGIVKKPRCRLFRMIGTVLGEGTTNAILESGGTLAVGNLLGDLARMNMQSSSRYKLFIDLSCVNEDGNGEVLDGANLYDMSLEGLGSEYHGCVGLCVPRGRVDFTRDDSTVVGYADWYDAATLEFRGSSDITLDMLARVNRKLPREVHI